MKIKARNAHAQPKIPFRPIDHAGKGPTELKTWQKNNNLKTKKTHEN